jgi:hypothetical protein
MRWVDVWSNGALGRASLLLRLAESGAGSPARRRGNFLLRGQKKVTKEEALNRTPAPHARAAPCSSPTAVAHTRPAALSLLSLSPAPSIAPPARLTPAARRAHEECQNSGARAPHSAALTRPTRRPSDAAFAFADKPGVQPALTGVKGRWMVLVIGTAARAQRLASGRNASGRSRAPLMASSRSCAVQRLFFGDFLLAPQKKVTRPPGRTPGTTFGINQAQRGTSHRLPVESTL